MAALGAAGARRARAARTRTRREPAAVRAPANFAPLCSVRCVSLGCAVLCCVQFAASCSRAAITQRAYVTAAERPAGPAGAPSGALRARANIVSSHNSRTASRASRRTRPAGPAANDILMAPLVAQASSCRSRRRLGRAAHEQASSRQTVTVASRQFGGAGRRAPAGGHGNQAGRPPVAPRRRPVAGSSGATRGAT